MWAQFSAVMLLAACGGEPEPVINEALVDEYVEVNAYAVELVGLSEAYTRCAAEEMLVLLEEDRFRLFMQYQYQMRAIWQPVVDEGGKQITVEAIHEVIRESLGEAELDYKLELDHMLSEAIAEATTEITKDIFPEEIAEEIEEALEDQANDVEERHYLDTIDDYASESGSLMGASWFAQYRCFPLIRGDTRSDSSHPIRDEVERITTNLWTPDE